MDDRAQNNGRLSRIAVALGKPETAFLNGSEGLADLDDAVELLRIWDRLEHSTDRRKALAFMRSLATKV